MKSQSNKHSKVQVWELAGWIATVTIYSLLTILYLFPYYNPWYRVPVNLLSLALFFIGIATIAFVLIPRSFYKKRFYKSAACIVLGFLLLVETKHAYDWRVQLTEKLIQTHYCREDMVIHKGTVLGGIINAGGVFFNKHHCPIAICKEVYYCDNRETEPHSKQRQWLMFVCLG